MRNKIRGKVFIINNEKFEKKLSFREGSDVDAKNLESLFTQLQFQVVIAKNQTAQVYIYILFYGVLRYFQQYFSYIVAVSFIVGVIQITHIKLPTCRK